MYVIKASGQKTSFDKSRVYKTCLRAGADKDLANNIVNEVDKYVYNGIETKEILKLILKLLRRSNPIVATRYSLKKAVLNLGPSGFVFEKFMVRFLQIYEYDAYLPDIIKGVCAKHEIDIVAESTILPESMEWIKSFRKNIYMIECKYHNQPGIRCGLKVALYTWARFLDIQGAWRRGQGKKFDSAWLISNTKFSKSAIEYARCKQIRLLGWRYPNDRGLEYLIEEKKIYPVTILMSLDRFSRDKLFAEDIILCQDLVTAKKNVLLKKTKIKDTKLNKLINEAQLII